MDLNFTDKKQDRDLDRLITDDELDKLYQAFNDYKKERFMDDVDPKDFMDKYLAENYDAHSTIMQISRDFEEFEKTDLSPATKTSIEFNNNIDELGENVHEFERMIEEMDSTTCQCTNNNAHPSYSSFGCYSNLVCYDVDGGGGRQLISGSSNYESSTIMQISKDFEAFESAMDFNNNIDQLGEDVDETERMIEEMASGTPQYTSSNAHPSYNPFGSYSNVTNVVCYEGHGGGGGRLVNDTTNNFSGPIIRYFYCGPTKNVVKLANNYRRKRQKRKYRGVVMSDQVRLLKMAKQKIKNREVAARTHEMRMAREAYLESQHAELLKQNNYLKKVNTFLEDHKRVYMPPESLTRSISEPMLI
ncbi:hypothetical protein K7X08_009006 [Anisodus acutangulus]|uniref:BZIP domain-containing protein n=1 Tax=Anisodus acutangulus TaxID=402998 RepID=A0A9Q1RQE1_9SOLA|nr:hypothetical protein K7X08_009006 [Anisodus acutangulus]